MTELIIGDVRPRNQYAADGVQTIFPYDFPILDVVDLEVVYDDGDTPGAFTVTGAGLSNGGDVVFDVAPAMGTRVTLYRDMPFTRETDFQESGDFRASVINEELDRMAMLLQQAEMIVEDGLRKQPYDTDDPLILPSSADRASKMLGFDVDGLPITLADPFVSSTAGEIFAANAAASADSASASSDAASVSAAAAVIEVGFALNQAVPVDVFTGDGVTTVFTLSRSLMNSTSAILTIDGVKQRIASYTIADSTLTFSSAPTDTSVIEVVMIGFMGVIGDAGEIADDVLNGDMVSGGRMDDISVDGLNGGPLAGLRNRFINGDFRIWRRGVSFTANSEYTADRFEHTIAGGSTATISRRNFTVGQSDVPDEPEFYYRFDKTVHVAGFPVMVRQKIEDVRTFAGQTMTVSFWARIATGTATCSVQAYQNFGSGGSATVTQFSNVTLTTTWRRFTKTFTMASIAGKTIGADSHLYIAVTFAGLGTIQADFALMQVEIGTEATPFENRPPALELAMCQRYFLKLGENSASARVIANGFCTGADRLHTLIPTPVTMRAAPTISGGAEGVRQNGSSRVVVSYSNIEVVQNGVNVQANVASGLTDNFAGTLVNEAGNFELDAEI